jgi:hypothetical protein
VEALRLVESGNHLVGDEIDKHLTDGDEVVLTLTHD